MTSYRQRTRLLKINEEFLEERGFLIGNELLDIETGDFIRAYNVRKTKKYIDRVNELVGEIFARDEEERIRQQEEQSEQKFDNVDDVNNYLANDGVFSIRQLRQFYKLMDSNQRYEIVFQTENGYTYKIPIHLDNQGDIDLMLSNRYFENIERSYKSDIFNKITVQGITNISIQPIQQGDVVRENKSGSFFEYVNKSGLDLIKYQIVNEIGTTLGYLDEHCFIYSLMKSGVEKYKIESLKLELKEGSHLSRSSIPKICDILKTKIILHFYKNDGVKKDKSVYGKEYENTIEICLFKGHYFIYEETPYSVCYIKNLALCQEKKYPFDVLKISERQIKTNKDVKKMNSLSCIKSLFDQGYFERMDILLDEHRIKTKSEIDFDFDEEIIYHECKEVEDSESLKLKSIDPKNGKKFIYYADCESDVVSDKIHTPILIGVIGEEQKEPTIFTNYKDEKTMVNSFLSFIKNDMKNKDYRPVVGTDAKGKPILRYDQVKVYFHNMKYDYAGLLQKYCKTKKAVVKDNNYYSITVNHYGLDIVFCDSLKLMNQALAKFPKIFELDEKYTKKEAIGYTYHTKQNIKKGFTRISVDEYLKHITRTGKYTIESEPEKIKEEFISILSKNAKEFEYYCGKFNPAKYYKYYLKYDVLVLQQGMKKYTEIMKYITGLNLHDYLTISSLTDNYMRQNGAYDGVCEMKGSVREFCSRSILGGRVNACPDFVKKEIEEEISDFDGVSLYPSSMYRLCQEMGLPLGVPKIINTFQPEEYDYYIVQIKLTKINKKQQNPFIGVKNKDGIVEYINEVEEPVILYVDKITLEDYIKFHKIEYEFVKGLYWNEGFNKKLGSLVKHLFDSRLKYKKEEKECLQEVLKLMMNSVYGKTIIKASNKKINFVNKNRHKKIDDEENKGNKKWVLDGKDGDFGRNYICANFKTILKYREINDEQLEVHQYALDNSYNRCHAGSIILSYSKRIINEVFNTANDNGLDIYYGDTDSLHLKDSDIPKLEKEYNKIYGRELIGKQLGQFHSDFELDGAKKGAKIVSTNSIFLGKKCYIDKLKSINDKGEEITGWHIRLKGMSREGVDYEVNKNYNGDYLGLFRDLANGIEKEMIINPYKSKVSFEYCPLLGGVSTRKQMSFKRKICFGKKE